MRPLDRLAPQQLGHLRLREHIARLEAGIGERAARKPKGEPPIEEEAHALRIALLHLNGGDSAGERASGVPRFAIGRC